jgi:GT2 family glycosyltransferase
VKNIGAIVVTFNGERWIDRCFSHLINEVLIKNIYVIDNGSTDQTLSRIQGFNCEKINIVKNKSNLGFGRANNLGIEMALQHNVDGLLLINQDAWLLQGSLEEMIRVLKENMHLGIVSPIHLDGGKRDFDKPFEQYISEVMSDEKKNQILTSKIKEEFFDVSFVNAACWLLSIECVKKIGLFDSLFRHYGEDNDYLHRLKYHNYCIAIVPKSFIIHDRQDRSENEFHQFRVSRYRFYLMTLMNINIPFNRAIFTSINENFKSNKEHLICRNGVRILKEALALFQCYLLIPKIALHRRKNSSRS